MKNTDIYKKNIEILGKRYPDICLLLNERKYEYPYLYKKFLNDKAEVNISVNLPGTSDMLFYDAREGGGIMDTAIETISSPLLKKHDVLICIGIGLGYIPLAAARTYTDNPRIVIMEHFPEAFQLAISMVDLTDLFEYENLDIYLGRNFSVSEVIFSYKDDLYVGRCRRITHIPSRKIYGEGFISFEREIDENIKLMLTGWNTIRKHGNSTFENGIQNLTSLFNGITVDRLKNKFTGIPAVVVASGPSLGKSLNGLKKIKENALILSCDSAVKPLIRERIVPHMVFSVDHMNSDFDKIRFNLEELRQSILVYWMDTNADSVRGYLGTRRIAALSEDDFKNTWIRSEFGFDFKLPGLVSSNADMAVLTAVYMGCDPIVLAGMDLAYSEGKDHVNGAVIKSQYNLRNLVTIEGLKGYPVYSIQAMVTGRNLMEKNINSCSRNFIDISLSGAYIKGSQIKSLAEFRESVLQKRFELDKCFEQIDWQTPFSPEKIEISLKNIVNITHNLATDARDGLVMVCKLIKVFQKIKHKEAIHKIKQTLKLLTRFKARYKIILAMIRNYRYDDQLDIDRRTVNMDKGNGLTIDYLNNETLKIQKKYYKSIYIAARKIHRRLDGKRAYFQKINRLNRLLKAGVDRDKTYLELARTHAKENVVWLSEQAYKSYLKIHPDDSSAISELAKLYMDTGLWRQAGGIIAYSASHRADDLQLESIKAKFEKRLSGLLESAKTKITANDEQTTFIGDARREVLEYLSVFPKNQEALLLLEKIEKIENEQENNINKIIGFAYSPEQCAYLEEKAKLFVMEGEPEKAIGIYEGLAERFAEKEYRYRTRIGDIRFGQRDFVSALWNYNRGLKQCPGDKKLKTRVRFASPFVDAMLLAKNDSCFMTTVIMPFVASVDAIIESMKNIDKTVHTPCEILLICRPEEEHVCSKIINSTPLKSKPAILVSEFDLLSPKALNMALKMAKGTYIVLLDPVYEFSNRCIDILLRRLVKRKFVGLVQPLIYEYKSTANGNQNGTAYQGCSFPMRNCSCLFLSFKRNLLIKTGLLDEACGNVAEMLEDLRLRACLEGFYNMVTADVCVYRSNGGRFQQTNHDSLSEKWQKDSVPAHYHERYEILKICETADVFLMKGKIERAIITLVNGISIYPDCEIFYRSIAHILIGEKRYSEAIETLNAIPNHSLPVINHPRNLKSTFNGVWECQELKAYAFLGEGNAGTAIQLSDRTLAEYPKNARMLNLKGMASFMARDYKDAKKYFESAIRADDACGLAWLNLGKINQIEGSKAAALKLIRKGFLRSPENNEIAHEYYRMVCQEEKYDEAIRHFEKTIKWLPENKCLHYLLIDLLIRSGRYEDAMMLIEMSIIKFGKDDGILDAALKMRMQLGPTGNKGNSKENTAAVNINSEIDNFEAFLYDLKSITKNIDFLDNGNSPVSKKIAAIFGASIVSEKTGVKNSARYKWKFNHHDVLNWLHQMESPSSVKSSHINEDFAK